MRRLLGIEFKRRTRMLLWLAIAAAATVALIFALDRYVVSVETMLAKLPVELKAAFAITEDAGGAMLPVVFIELVSMAVGAVFACFIGGCSFASDLESGAIEFIYSKPVTRFQIFLSKFICQFTLLAEYILLSSAICYVLFALTGGAPSGTPEVLLYGYLAVFAICLFFCSISALISSLFNGVSASLVSIIALFVVTLFGAAGHFYSEIEPFSRFAPTICLSPFTLLSQSGAPLTLMAIYFTASLGIFALSSLVICRRDLVI